MTEQKKEEKKEVAVDLECDDEFEEFGNEGESRAPEPNPGSRDRPDISPQSYPSEISRSDRPSSPSFVRAEWGAEEEDAEDVNQWEEDWDDSEKSDDFTRQLRAELEKFA